jgi:hypothetical protein
VQLWEYQTLTVRQNNDKVIEVTHVNSKEAAIEVTGRIIKSKTYHDLPSYLARSGRQGWEVVGMSPMTSFGAGSMANEGSINIMLMLKRPLDTQAPETEHAINGASTLDDVQ